VQAIALISIVLCTVIIFTKYYQASYDFTSVKIIFVLYMGLYTILSFLLTGIYTHPIEQYLYLVNIAVILFVLPSLKDNFDVREELPGKWLITALFSLLIIAGLALIAIYSHGELKGSQIRFI
jgi:hypothetical protein